MSPSPSSSPPPTSSQARKHPWNSFSRSDPSLVWPSSSRLGPQNASRRFNPEDTRRKWYKSKRWWWVTGLLVASAAMIAGAIVHIRREDKYLEALANSRNRLALQSQQTSPPYYPTPLGGILPEWADSYEKARTLVGRMSLLEKVNVTTGVGWAIGPCFGNTGSTTVGFPSLCLHEGPSGLRGVANVSVFPPGITVGATWNKDLMYQRGKSYGHEARIKGVNVVLAPLVGPLGSLPAGGRNWEGFGSDPVLQGVAAAETIKGIQSSGVMASVRHYVLDEQEHYRQGDNDTSVLSANIDDRTLREVYVWPFAESVRAGVASVMCAPLKVNGSYACQNSALLNGILKDELGFQGFVLSSWHATHSGVASALAGLDMSMPGDISPDRHDGASYFGANLTLAVLNGSLPMARLDDMATRIVAAWYQFGQDNWPVHDRASYSSARFTAWNGSSSNPYPDVNARGNHNRIIRRIGAEGTVLLKNDRHFLPLPYPNDTLWANLAGKNGTFRIGVFGTAAGSGKGNGSMVNPATVTPWEALKDAFVNQTAVKISPFLSDVATSDEDLATQDLCLVFASTASGYSGDRNTIMLQNDTEKLIHEVAGKCGGKGEKGDTVVVMYSVGPVIVESFIEHSKVRSVLLAHLPGEEGGHALTDVLFGLKEPSGRLPYTIGKTLADYGPDAQVLSETKDAAAPQKDFSAAGRYIDYRYFDSHNVTPRFEFGYGLSYTRFDLSALQLMPLRPLREVPDPPPRQGNATTTSSALRFMEMSNNPATSNVNMNPHLALAPKKFHKTKGHVYPYISSTKQVQHGRGRGGYPYPAGYSSTQRPSSAAGGGLGGNPSLYDEVLGVSALVTNVGERAGAEVVQVYVSFPEKIHDSNADGGGSGMSGAEKFPPRMLRAFSKVSLRPGETRNVTMKLTQKDLSYWSTWRQNWVMPLGGSNFTIWVGRSSRDLPLQGVLYMR